MWNFVYPLARCIYLALGCYGTWCRKRLYGCGSSNVLDKLKITTKTVPIEADQSRTVPERYHAPGRRMCDILEQATKELDDELALKSSVKPVSETMGLEGLVPTLLDWGTCLQTGFTVEKPTSSTYKRAAAKHKALRKYHKLFAQWQLQDVLCARNGCWVEHLHNVRFAGLFWYTD